VEQKLAAARTAKQAPLQGKTEYQVMDPKNPERTITDIDRIDGNTLWEEKSATDAKNRLTGADETPKWIQKQITDKFQRYLEARKLMPGFNDAQIGFHFTSPGADPAFRAAVEAEIARLRSANPGVDIVVKWE
jgi:hypothetical protein